MQRRAFLTALASLPFVGKALTATSPVAVPVSDFDTTSGHLNERVFYDTPSQIALDFARAFGAAMTKAGVRMKVANLLDSEQRHLGYERGQCAVFSDGPVTLEQFHVQADLRRREYVLTAAQTLAALCASAGVNRFVPMELPGGMYVAERVINKTLGYSIRLLASYSILSDARICRFDVLGGRA